MTLRRSLQAATFAVLFAPAGAALAQGSDADRAAARSLAQQGQDALDKRDFATAADRFARAGELVHAPTLALGLARAQVGLGKWISAQETYNRIVRDGAPAHAPPAFLKALGDAKNELDALEPRIPNVVIDVKGAGAASAAVTLDGAPVPRALLGVSRPVDPGAHLVRAQAAGFAPVEADLTVLERKTEKVTLSLDRPAVEAALPLTTGPLSVPASVLPPPPDESPLPQPHQGVPVRRTVGFVLMDVGAAGIVMGAITGGLAVAKHNALNSKCIGGHCPTTEGHDIATYHLYTDLSDVGFVVGGALAATGVVLFVVSPKHAKPKDAALTPVVGAGWLGMKGSF